MQSKCRFSFAGIKYLSESTQVGQNPFAQQEVAASQAPAGEQNAGGVQEMQIFLEDPDQVPAGGHDDAEQVPGSQPPPPSQPVDDDSLLAPAGEEDFNFVDGAIPEDADADDVENHPPNPYVEVPVAAAANRGNAPLAAAEDEGEMIARIGAAGAPAGQQQFAVPKSAARAGPYGQFGNGAAPPRNNNFGAGFQLQHNGYGAAGPAGVRINNAGGNQFGGQQFGGAARGFGGGFGNANNAGANMELGFGGVARRAVPAVRNGAQPGNAVPQQQARPGAANVQGERGDGHVGARAEPPANVPAAAARQAGPYQGDQFGGQAAVNGAPRNNNVLCLCVLWR